MNGYNITDSTVPIMQNACDIWTGYFDSPDSLTSPVVGAVQRKVLESEDRILS